MNANDEVNLRNTIKELIRLKIKPNFAALGREYGCDYRTAKIRYYEEINKEKVAMKYWLPEHIKQFFDVLEKDINSSNSRVSYNAYLIKMLTLLTFNLGDRIGETRVICYSNIQRNTIQ